MIDRRELLAGATAALALVPEMARAGTPTMGEPSLQILAASKGLTFGSSAGMGAWGSLGGSLRDPDYRQILIRQCGGLVCENEMKWGALRPDQHRFNWTGADALAAFAQTHDMALRGHTLLWHHPQWFPDWLTNHDFGTAPAAEAERLVSEHVAAVCGRYPQIVSWDVVNEAVDADTGGLRDTSLSNAMGHGVIDLAFHAARDAAPDTQLLYNDYMSWEAGHEKHRAGVLRLLEGLVARGVPIDGLGVQSHIGSGNTDGSVGFDTAQDRQWRLFLDEVTGMGLDLVITEFDVHDKNLPARTAPRDRAVADLARRYLDLMFDYRQTRAITAWGMVDSYSWLQNLWPRADGIAKRPTPFDAAYRAKPLHTAIAAALRSAPAREPLDRRPARRN